MNSYIMGRRERVVASGGEVGRLNIFGGAEVSFFLQLCGTLVKEIENRILKYYIS